MMSSFLVFGNDVTGTSGQIASPLWPHASYPNNADYRWTISVDSDYYISIRFLDMDIEDLYNCYYDNLRVDLFELCFAVPKPHEMFASILSTRCFSSET